MKCALALTFFSSSQYEFGEACVPALAVEPAARVRIRALHDTQDEQACRDEKFHQTFVTLAPMTDVLALSSATAETGHLRLHPHVTERCS